MSEQAPSMPSSDAGQASDDAVFFVALQYRGASYGVPVQAEDAIASIFDFAQEALDFPRENCKLIHRGKMLRPDHDSLTVGEAGLQAGTKLMLVASSAHDVSFVQSSRADPLVKGFVEEERDEISRRKRAKAGMASAWGTKQDKQYRFNSIKAEFKFIEPPPFDAEKLLQRLATDPGIIDLMTSRRFTVGILTEMSPVEAQDRMAKRGTPDMDLLGYNQNAGEMIVLKLRTDTLKGFRPYHDLINTLIHEMTHNVWGPHDQNFWKLYGELKAQYMRFHRFWSHGGKSAADGPGKQFQGFVGDDDDDGKEASGFGQTLGGDGSALGNLTPRSRAAMAAEARKSMGNGPDEAPKPNFLTSDGIWVVMCPCGLVHDPAGCTVAQTLAAGGKVDEDDDEDAINAILDNARAPKNTAATGDVPSAAADVSAAVAADVEMPQAASESTAEAQEGVAAAGAAAPCPAEPAADAPSPAAPAAAAADAEPAADTPMEVDVVGSDASQPSAPSVPPRPDAAETTGGSSGSSSRPPAQYMGEDLGLELAELEAQGLDGASLWLARFSTHLRALRGSHGEQQARAASELLMRLVQNIINSPQDPKFRRIRADNSKFRSSLLAAGEQAEALMRMLGFESTSEDGSRMFVLRDASLDRVRLQLGKEILEQELQGGFISVR
mmetsp:Transcript_24914/g.70937  ORF Transcript_24914/g.70937 Transcript_24914/m.70937 type:complete len:666 (+) Transcript_24914:96-2093(+)